MKQLSESLKLFLNLAKIQAVMTRRFDNGLNGLSMTEFMILYHLSITEGEQMRRTDLAEKIGLTASGVTRILLPMEKIGLVKRAQNEHDARVSLVALAPGGKTKLSESIERAEVLADDIILATHLKKVDQLSELIMELGGTVV